MRSRSRLVSLIEFFPPIHESVGLYLSCGESACDLHANKAFRCEDPTDHHPAERQHRDHVEGEYDLEATLATANESFESNAFSPYLSYEVMHARNLIDALEDIRPRCHHLNFR